MPPELGSTRDNPVYFRFLRDDENNLDIKKVLVMLALTILSGYLAVQSQRIGSSPDQLRSARMRYHRAAGRVAASQGKFWTEIAKHHADRYEIARL
jgi:hypothetical protein